MLDVLPLSQTSLTFAQVAPFITRAFETAEHADGAEARLTQHLRSVVCRALPDLEFVALEEGRLCGYVLLSRTTVELPGGLLDAVLVAPLCVALEKRSTGVGSALMRRALAQAAARGERLALLLGEPDYYARFGFEPFATAALVIKGADDEALRRMSPYAQWLALDPANRRDFTRFLQGGRADLLMQETY